MAEDGKARPKHMSSRLVIGGAQLGASYGIANTTGAPTREKLLQILALACAADVGWIDTARAYAGSEAAIGDALTEFGRWQPFIVTKVVPLQAYEGNDPKVIGMRVRESLAGSRQSLRRSRLDVVLLHRWQDLRRGHGVVSDILQTEVASGQVGTVGASIQSPEELIEALNTEWVGHVQVPFNILDHRWDAVIPAIRRARARRSLLVHVRSVLLQGLLLSTNLAHWRAAHVTDATGVIGWLHDRMRDCNRRSVHDLCFSWARAQDWIDGLVVGVETPEQMAENLKELTTPPLSDEAIDAIGATRPHLALESLNPALWIRG